VNKTLRSSEYAKSARPRGVCLLTHGINGTPDDLDELGATLREQGYATVFLTLPGHGTTIHDMARHGWDEWLAAVQDATDTALAREATPGGRPVFLIGHSLGAALTLAAAARRPELAGVVAMCPPVRLASSLEPAVGTLRRVTPFIPAWGEDIRDLKRRLQSRRGTYRWTPTASLHSLLRALPWLRRQIPQITASSLVIAARHDHVVPLRDAHEAYELLGAERKRLVVLERSYHAVARDVERHLVFEHVSAFCDEQAASWPERSSEAGSATLSAALTDLTATLSEELSA
jgi:carboxylesterase